MKGREVVLCWVSRARVAFGSFLLSITAGGGLLAADLKTVGVVCHCRAEFPMLKAFEAGLTELGWHDGSNLRIMRRVSDGEADRLYKAAEEIANSKPDVIFAGFTPAVIALQRNTSLTPVVFAGVSDAAEIGAASHFNRPERNFTGSITINRELMPKRLELLKEALPALTNIGYLANPHYGLHKPQLQEMEAAAQRLGVVLSLVEVTTADELATAFVQLRAKGAQAFVVQQDPLFTGEDKRVVAFAEAYGLPAIYPLRGFYDAGGLMWLGADVGSQFHRAATYVDKILRGAQPAELPIERPDRLYLTVNIKLARRLGIDINPSVLARADEVIE